MNIVFDKTFLYIRNFLKPHFTFSGRASRSEYWLTSTYYAIAMGLCRLADEFTNIYMLKFYYIAIVATFVPMLFLSIRRMHDTDRSGEWLFLHFLPFGNFVLLFWTCTRGTVGKNRFGDDPLGGDKNVAPPLPQPDNMTGEMETSHSPEMKD